MSIHISCDMYLRHGLHVQIRLYYVLLYKAKVSAQHGIGFILDRCIVCSGLTMPIWQKKRRLIFEIFTIKKCTLFLEPSISNLYAFRFQRGRILKISFFVSMFQLVNPGTGPVLTPGASNEQLGRGPQGDAIYQISNLLPSSFKEEEFLHFLSFFLCSNL